MTNQEVRKLLKTLRFNPLRYGFPELAIDEAWIRITQHQEVNPDDFDVVADVIDEIFDEE